MAELYPVAGSKIFIGGPVLGTTSASDYDFSNEPWTEISGWVNAGEVGDTQDVGEQALINERRVRKFKSVLNAGNMDNQFVPVPGDPGQQKLRMAEKACGNYSFKIEWGEGCQEDARSATVTISVADPAVVTWPAHNFFAGQAVTFTAPTLPTGITEGTVYYVLASGMTPNSFQISETSGGAPVAVTAAGTGDIVGTSVEAVDTTYFLGMPVTGQRTGGDAATLQLRTHTIAVKDISEGFFIVAP